MTDLEKQWDDLTASPVPIDAILRDAHRAAAAERRRRPEARLKRSLTGVAVVGGIAAAFVAGTLVTTPGPSDAPPAAGSAGGGAVADSLDGGLAPVAFHGELQGAESCDALRQHYVDRAVDLVGSYGWGGPGVVTWYGERDGLGLASPALPDAFDEQRRPPQFFSGDMPQVGGLLTATTSDTGARTSRAESSKTGTNVQEAGVDEPDTVKTDGSLLVRLRGAELTTYDVSGSVADGITELGSLDLGDFHDGEILLAGDTVVAVGNDGTRYSGTDYRVNYYGNGPDAPSPQTRVLSVDIADPAAPTLEQTVDYDASLVAARQHGDDVRVVLSKGLPDLDFDTDGTPKALDVNRTAVEESTIDDWMPHVSVDGGEPTDLLACDRVAIPRADIGLATMAVVGFGADAPATTESFGLAGDAPLTYESTDHLYLAASGNGFDTCFECFRGAALDLDGNDGTTHVYDFELSGTTATYVGAGEVEGHVRDRWSMDEADGVLRVAVGPSSETDDANSIVTMRAEGDELVEVGRIDRLGVGEDIKAVRWFDDLALLVTFRQVDPLYAVDLTDVSAPRLLGELKIPGFSTYLHPLGPRRIIGIGSDGGWKAQAGLFNVTDLTDPQRLSVVTYGGNTVAKAGADPRQFTWLPDERVALTVIQRGNVGYVSRLDVAEGRLSNAMTKVEFGRDVDEVRLVPVGGGKVALVTGEDVEFFDLS